MTAAARLPRLVVKDTDGGSRWLVPNIAGQGVVRGEHQAFRGNRAGGVGQWDDPCVIVI